MHQSAAPHDAGRSPDRHHPHRTLLLLAAALLWAGCSDLFHDAAPPLPASLAVSYAPAFATAPGDPLSDAFDRANRARVLVLDARTRGVMADTLLAVVPGNEEIRLAFRVPLEGERLQAVVEITLLLDQEPLFAGSVPLDLRAGQQANAQVPLQPEPTRLEIVAPPTFQSLGSSVSLVAQPFMATGDLLAGLVPTWESLDPSVLEVTAGGEATVRSEGTARVGARLPNLTSQETLEIRVRVDRIQVTPPSHTLLLDADVQLQGQPLEVGGSPLEGRFILWNSSDTTVARVDLGGRVTGLRIGEAILSAQTEGATGEAVITVLPPPPEVTSLGADEVTPSSALLLGSANPNRGPTQGWFEWGNAPSPASFQRTAPVPLGDGTEEVAFQLPLERLIPGRTYFARAIAASVGGQHAGAVFYFTTVQILPPAPSGLTADPEAGVGVRLRWTSNSLNEDHFLVEWKRRDEAAFRPLPLVPAGTTTLFHPESAWGFRDYRVSACNELGCSAPTTLSAFLPFDEPEIRFDRDGVALDPTLAPTVTVGAAVEDPQGRILDRPVSWSSSDPDVFTVSDSGVVSAVAPGTGVLTASIDGGVTATLPVRVLPPPTFRLTRVEDLRTDLTRFRGGVFAPGRSARLLVRHAVVTPLGDTLAVRTPVAANRDDMPEGEEELVVDAPAIPQGRVLDFTVEFQLAMGDGPFQTFATRRSLAMGPPATPGVLVVTLAPDLEPGGYRFRGELPSGNTVPGNPGIWLVVDGVTYFPDFPRWLLLAGGVPDMQLVSSFFTISLWPFLPEQRVEVQAVARTLEGFLYAGARLVVQEGSGGGAPPLAGAAMEAAVGWGAGAPMVPRDGAGGIRATPSAP